MLNRTANRGMLLAAAIGVTLPLLGKAANATSISVYGSNPVVQGSIGTGTGLGTDGYYMYHVIPTGGGSASDTLSPVSYASISTPVSTGSTEYGASSSYSTLKISGASNYTGELAYDTGNTTTNESLATITLTGTVPSEFQLAFLENNNPNSQNNGGGNDTDYSVTIFSAQGQSLATATVTDTVTGTSAESQDDFFETDITGATAGDTIQVVGVNVGTNGFVVLGGMTFDTIVAAPEPASLGLVAIAMAGSLGRRRARRA